MIQNPSSTGSTSAWIPAFAGMTGRRQRLAWRRNMKYSRLT
jgi:hypothetical protein